MSKRVILDIEVSRAFEADTPLDAPLTKNSYHVAEALEVAVKITSSPSHITLLPLGLMVEDKATGGELPPAPPIVIVTVLE